MSTYKLLVAARKNIDSPAKWIQYHSAKSEHGEIVPATSHLAACFCSVGAVQCVTPDIEARQKAYVALSDAAQTTGDMPITGIAGYNDTHTYDQVMAVWDRAIERAAKIEGLA